MLAHLQAQLHLAGQLCVCLYCLCLVALFLPSALNWQRPPPLPALWPQRRAVEDLLLRCGAATAVEVGSGVYPILLGWSRSAVGIELSWLAWVLSRLLGQVRGSDMFLLRGNALTSLPVGDAYVLYLGQQLGQQVADLAPRADVISVAFPVSGRPLLQETKTCVGPVYWYGPKC